MTSILEVRDNYDLPLDYTFDFQGILDRVPGSDGYCEFVLDRAAETFEWGGLAMLATSAVVDWGDGTAENVAEFTGEPVSHVYWTPQEPEEGEEPEANPRTEDYVLKVWLTGYRPAGTNPADVTIDEVTTPGHSSELYTLQEHTALIKGVNRYILANPAVTTLPDYMFACTSDTVGYYNLEEFGDNSIYLKYVTSFGTLSFKANSTSQLNKYVKRIGDFFFRADAIVNASVGGTTYGWFYNCRRLESMGEGLFYFPSAASVTLDGVFQQCSNLKCPIRRGFVRSERPDCGYTFKATFAGAGITRIDQGAFRFTTTGNVGFAPASSSVSGYGAFFSSSIVSIQPEAFVYNCSSDTGVMNFGGYSQTYGAFYSCGQLETIDGSFVLNGSGKMTFQGTSTYGGAFYSLSKLRELNRAFTVNGSGSMTFGGSTHAAAFYQCRQLQTIYKGFTVNGAGSMDFHGTSTNGGAFYYCDRLSLIEHGFLVNGSGSMNFSSSSSGGVFQNCGSITTVAHAFAIHGSGSMNFSSSSSGVFQNCGSITTVAHAFAIHGSGSMNFSSSSSSSGGVFQNCTNLIELSSRTFSIYGPGSMEFLSDYGSSSGGPLSGMSNLTTLKTEAFYSENGSFIFCSGSYTPMFNSCSKLTTFEPGSWTMKGSGTLTMYGSGVSTYAMLKTPPLITVVNCFDIANSVAWTNVAYMFQGKNQITSSLPLLWNRNPLPAIYNKCFEGCTNASNYASVPTAWK